MQLELNWRIFYKLRSPIIFKGTPRSRTSEMAHLSSRIHQQGFTYSQPLRFEVGEVSFSWLLFHIISLFCRFISIPLPCSSCAYFTTVIAEIFVRNLISHIYEIKRRQKKIGRIQVYVTPSLLCKIYIVRKFVNASVWNFTRTKFLRLQQLCMQTV